VSKAWAAGSTPQWRRIRAKVLARDHYRCRIHIEGICTTIATQVHHTRPRTVVGDDERYLQAACKACNLHVGEPGRHDPVVYRDRWWESSESQ
jgi:5-methylcytosine-specific restriction endonuclease McrA